MTYEGPLVALADPTRRRLLEQLAQRDHTVGELALIIQVSQPAVSQHLRVLRDARLVTTRTEGTRHYYRADREGLAHLRRYLEAMWDDVLASFAADDPQPPDQNREK